MITCYLISYDLRKYDKDYNKLYEAIGKLSYSKRVLESFWFVKSDKSHGDLFKYLWATMDSNDWLYVTKYSGLSTFNWVLCKKEDIIWQC